MAVQLAGDTHHALITLQVNNSIREGFRPYLSPGFLLLLHLTPGSVGQRPGGWS